MGAEVTNRGGTASDRANHSLKSINAPTSVAREANGGGSHEVARRNAHQFRGTGDATPGDPVPCSAGLDLAAQRHVEASA